MLHEGEPGRVHDCKKSARELPPPFRDIALSGGFRCKGKGSINCSIFLSNLSLLCVFAIAYPLFSSIFMTIIIGIIMTERIRKIMEDAQMTQQEFAAKLGISPASLSGILNGRSEPTRKHAEAIHRAFPRINVNWLMFGEGEMFNSPSSVSSTDDAPSESSEVASEAGQSQLFGESDVQSAAPSSLFDAAPLPSSPSPAIDRKVQAYGSRRDYQQRSASTIPSMGINFDKDERKIKEIRVFYSNGTYESFVPSNK